MSDELRALADENRRLRKEARLLHERVDALERSRWWRLHPRFLLRGRRQAPPERAPAAPTSDARTPSADGTVDRFRAEVVEHGEFSRDLFTRSIADLDPIVSALAGSGAEILEIGSFEGLSACFFLWRLPDARVTCVDPFHGIGDGTASGAALEAAFDRNVAQVGPERVRKVVGDSRRVLLDLLDEGRTFDLVYVDGSHMALDVLVDAALSWRLLRAGGALVFDDYTWNDSGDDPLLRPGPAIDAALGVLDGKHDLLFKGHQVAVRKR